MIDITTEALLSLTEAARRLPGRRGKRIHVATLHRWASRGVKGVQLETVRVGGTRCTSMEALQRFIERVTGPREPQAPAAPDAVRAAAIKRAEDVLNRARI